MRLPAMTTSQFSLNGEEEADPTNQDIDLSLEEKSNGEFYVLLQW
jgi:hypothetical protein